MNARTILQLDAIFELVLGCVLILAWPLGWFDLAGWEGWPAALVGAALVCAGSVLWVTPATPEVLRLLSLVNATGAGIFVGWLILWWDDFNGAGAVIVGATAGVLALLAVAELLMAARSDKPT